MLQSTLRSLRGGKDMTIETAEPVMLEQIGRISQQVGYYLHRASIGGDNTVLMRDISSVPALIDSLASALSKVYQRKGVDITVDIPPDITGWDSRMTLWKSWATLWKMPANTVWSLSR